jgi:hypothetical protein
MIAHGAAPKYFGRGGATLLVGRVEVADAGSFGYHLSRSQKVSINGRAGGQPPDSFATPPFSKCQQ